MDIKSIHVERIGDKGPDLVMLHGWGNSLEDLRLLGELLGASRRVHLVDLPGFGKSPAPEKAWSAFDYAETLQAYCAKECRGKPSLLGHSFGGKVAAAFAIRFPGEVGPLILINSSGLRPKRTYLQKCRSSGIRLLGRLCKWSDQQFGSSFFLSRFTPRFGSIDYQNAQGVMRDILVRTVNESLESELGKIESRTLLLWGADDQETPLEIGKRFQKGIADASLLTLSHKGHHPFLDVGSHLCAYHISPFLAENTSHVD